MCAPETEMEARDDGWGDYDDLPVDEDERGAREEWEPVAYRDHVEEAFQKEVRNGQSND